MSSVNIYLVLESHNWRKVFFQLKKGGLFLSITLKILNAWDKMKMTNIVNVC